MKQKFLFSLVILTVGISHAFAQGTLVYDQRVSSSFLAGGLVIQNSSPIGQSVTPALDSVGFVQLAFYDANPGNGLGATVYVNLLSGSTTGTVIASTDPVFMPDGFLFNGHSTQPGISTFYFATPAALTPGTTYYFQPVVQSGDLFSISIYSEYGYLGGTAYVQGVPGGDLWFTEGIVVPEPSTIGMFAFGALLLGWRFFPKRR